MQQAHLTEEETQEVLLRASEIAGLGAKQDSGATSIEAFLTAATEAGIPRAALEQALRERSITQRNWTVGERVFAKSADGKFYLAHVMAVHDAAYQVQFLRGGQATVAVDEVTSGQLLPGQRVICDWPGWGPWECTVVSFDETTGKIRASDGWTNVKTFPISEIKISAPRGKKHAESSGKYWLYSALVLGGGAIGSVITWWLTR